MRSRPLLGLMLWLLLALPPLRHLLEAGMSTHMLVQLPLLGLAGWLLAGLLPTRTQQRIAQWNRSGISGLLLISFTGLIWMLPLPLDAAIDHPLAELAKFLSVPLLLGLPLALSWPHAGFIVRGFFLVELIATTLRAGWLYLAVPARLCSNYLVDDQQQLGRLLLVTGAALGLMLAWKLLFGHIRVERDDIER